ncbi:MAG: SMP-30/gluconolactonase/LRE family protein [Phycisphaerae bacterium]
MKRFFALALVAAGTGVALGQDSQPATGPAWPAGEVLKFSYTAPESSVFPGTTRDYWIYIPSAYDGSKPACLFVDQDRVQFNAPRVFDELIASHEMPVTIGVFIAPGIVKAIDPAKQLPRYNRSYEFDGLSADYANFVLKEILPAVEKQHASDGRAIRLSTNPDDRMIAGSSSGGIASFTAAWERNDSFHRVFSAIGTFVDLRGGNIYPSLIRKYEPKPIRIFLQDGSNDHNHYGGDWWMANQEMERALTFAGYEVNHIYGTGGHEHKQADQIFPDAMRWLWKDWPRPVSAGRGSEQLQQVLLPGEGWQVAADHLASSDGPCADEEGNFYFCSPKSETIFRISAGDATPTAYATHFKSSAQHFAGPHYAIDSDHHQLVLSNGDAGNLLTVVAGNIHGNDFTIAHNGNLYLTESGGKPGDPHQVSLIKPGAEGKFESRVIDDGIKFPNGICLSPDQSLLYVSDYQSHWVYSYQIQPDGSVAEKQKFFDLYVRDAYDNAGGDGMCVDADGRLYVATRAGIQVCDQAGRVIAIIPTPNGRCSNVAFAGKDFSTLYATCGETVYCRHLKVHGLKPGAPPIKPAPPKL